jgi:hypothetical protein
LVVANRAISAYVLILNVCQRTYSSLLNILPDQE